MRAWKFVNPIHAPAALNGVFRIGTPDDYRDLEGPQADELDSGRRRTITHLAVTNFQDPLQQAAVETLKSMGFPMVQTGNFTFKNIQAIRRDHGHALCLCRDQANRSFGDKTAIIEIADVNDLALHLTLNNAALARRFRVAHVTYDDVDVEAQPDNDAPADPFVKSKRYECENELRIFWANRWATGFVSSAFVPPKGLLTWLNSE